MSDENTTMPFVDENWDRALAVVAHPDDLEYGMASAIARWTKQGKTITYLLVTSGEAGIDSLAPDQAAELRRDEERRSAKVVGVDQVEFLAHPDGTITESLELRRDIAAAIRRYRPEVIIGMNFHDTFAAGSRNQADHRVVGKAILDAVPAAGNRWIFPGAGAQPWNGVKFAIFGGSPEGNTAIDVTDTIEDGIASLKEHAVYLDGLNEGTFGKDPDPFLRGIAQMAGEVVGVEYAVIVELIAL